jgi:nickel/cobalt transporter (NiCoT) family protein
MIIPVFVILNALRHCRRTGRSIIWQKIRAGRCTGERMPFLSIASLPLYCAVFALGLRHGLDADHLATIDGLTRFNADSRPALARWCGALFSIGHGAVIVLGAITFSTAATQYTIPSWAQDFGVWISIAFLAILGLLNLALVIRTPATAPVRPTGLRSRLFSRLTRTTRPLSIAAIGALFAISFDALSQAALFSATAGRPGGWQGAALLGLLFMGGMLLVDGLNGVWVATLVTRNDGFARVTSRAIGLFVAVLSLATAALGAVRYFDRRLDASLESGEFVFGLLLVAAAAAGSVVFGRLGGRRPTQLSLR